MTLSTRIEVFTDLLWICRTACCTTSPQQKSTTSCTTNSKSRNKLYRPTELVAQQVHNKFTASCMQQSASRTASRTTCCTTNPQLVEVMESDINNAAPCVYTHGRCHQHCLHATRRRCNKRFFTFFIHVTFYTIITLLFFFDVFYLKNVVKCMCKNPTKNTVRGCLSNAFIDFGLLYT